MRSKLKSNGKSHHYCAIVLVNKTIIQYEAIVQQQGKKAETEEDRLEYRTNGIDAFNILSA
ncbi:MAG: hypothetical protein JXR61_01700 [Prolixibacteraceae bacterium]|nr:hypothetical protein [Prolixibacteraceae bacterium]